MTKEKKQKKEGKAKENEEENGKGREDVRRMYLPSSNSSANFPNRNFRISARASPL